MFAEQNFRSKCSSTKTLLPEKKTTRHEFHMQIKEDVMEDLMADVTEELIEDYIDRELDGGF